MKAVTLSKLRAWGLLTVSLLGAGAASATTPGPTTIIQCPGSDEIRQAPSINSGNTFGAIFWTDGFMVAPMMPRFPAITRCTADGPIFWVSSATVVGSLPPWRGDAASAPSSWRQAQTARELTGDELLEAIAQGLGDTPQKLSYLRHRAWWAANHARRPRSDAQAAPTAVSDFAAGSPARGNLEALVASLDESDAEQRLTKVEGLRELARFDDAAQLLDGGELKNDRLRPWVNLIRERIQLRDARVAKLKLER